MLSWAWMLSRRDPPVWHGWAWGIFAISVLYTALADAMIRRTRRLRAVAAATTLCDSAIVTLICLVTGGIHSDFYPYFYITVLAGSVRFGPRETFFALVLNTLCSMLVFVASPGPSYPAGDLLLEIYYMLFIALMSSWLSRLAREHYRRALQQGDRAGLLLSVNREINGTLDLSELLARILREAAHAIPCRGAALVLLDRGRERLERVLVTGAFLEPAPETMEHSLREGMLREAREAGGKIWNDPAVLGERDLEAARLLSRLAREAQAFAEETRRVMNGLRPTVLDDFGFIEALREYLAALQHRVDWT